MRNSAYVILLVTLIPFCNYGQSKRAFDEDKLLQRLETLSSDTFEGRRTGEKGNAMAREFIINEFKKLDTKPFGADYNQPFKFELKGKEYQGTNVLVAFMGTDKKEEYIVVSAHYDHLGIIDGNIYNGADDDASGTAALFAFAEYLTKNPPKHSILLAAFDAEEMGLKGAKYFVNNARNLNIIANINMDMIGRSERNELYVVGTRYSKELEDIIQNFKNPTSTRVLIGHDGSDDKEDWTQSSDHGPFYDAGIPFLYFGDEDHPGYHQATDDFKDITPEFYKNSVRIILSVFTKIDTTL